MPDDAQRDVSLLDILASEGAGCATIHGCTCPAWLLGLPQGVKIKTDQHIPFCHIHNADTVERMIDPPMETADRLV